MTLYNNNSKPLFNDFSAVSLGTDMLELDVHLTKDNEVVVAHDHDLQRTAQVSGSLGGEFYINLIFFEF